MPDIVIIDERKGGSAWEGGENLAVPEEGREGALITIADAKVLVTISEDGVWVKQGTGKVSLMSTKSEGELSLENAQEHLRTRGLADPQVEHDRDAALGKAFEALDADPEIRDDILAGKHV